MTPYTPLEIFRLIMGCLFAGAVIGSVATLLVFISL